MPKTKAKPDPSVAPRTIYQIKIVLLGTDPPIWRRVLVPADLTLAQLDRVVQAAMGWENCHLHDFLIAGQRFGVPSRDDWSMGGPRYSNEKKVMLGDVLSGPRAKAKYTYDFGDFWEHALTVERVVASEPGVSYPLCTAGERSGPPEDCGGIPGFYDMLEALADPDHEEHENMQEWTGGGFDPEAFSIDAVNQRLRKMIRPSRKPKAQRAVPSKSTAPSMKDLQDMMRAIVAEINRSRPQRQRIQPDDKVPLDLGDRERELILQCTSADEETTNRLLLAPPPGESPTYLFTLDELDDLAGSVAAEANHAKDRKIEKELDRLFERINTKLESYTDEDDGPIA